MRNNTLLWTLALSGIFFIIHALSLSFSLYWIFPPLDYVMHAIGGSIIGLLALMLCTKKQQSVVCAFFLALFFSFVWEYFELAIDATFVHSAYYLDTIIDIAVGICTSVCTAYIFFEEHHE